MRPKVLIMAPTPPPVMGPSIATTVLLNSRLEDTFQIKFIDTADRRSLRLLGKIDFQNIYLAVLHAWKLSWANILFRPEVVYLLITQTTIGLLRDSVFMIINRLFGKKQIVHLRGGYFPQYYEETSALMRWYIRTMLGWVDRFIVLCQRTKCEMEGILPEEKIVVIPNGCDLPLMDRPTHQERPSKVLYLGNLIRAKGFFDLLHAVPEVLEKTNCSVVFKLAGAWRSDEDRIEAEAFLADRGLTKNVEFTGPVSGERKYKLLSEASIFVFPTYYKYEGHPWVIVEALAAGLPIITTNHACIPETIADGVNGYIVPKNNPESIASKLVILLSDDKLRLKMSAGNQLYYEKYFTAEKFIAEISRCFSSVIGQINDR